MNDIFELEPTGKEVAVLILAVFILMVVGGTIGYCIGIRNVHNDGSGDAGVGQQIEQTQSNISNATSGIETAHGHADQIASGIESAKETANYLHGTATTSAGIIGECQQILAGIRNRGKKETVKN